MTRRDKQQDKHIWARMGRELAALHDLICDIQCDPEYNAVMDRKAWDRLNSLTHRLDIVRGEAESRMARFIPDWSLRTFYPIDREKLHAAIAEFRNSMK